MKKSFSVLVLLCCSLFLFAQPQTDRDAGRGVYRHYDFTLGTPDTPAPKGYKPFYISHYGRHGSRYPVDRNYLLTAVRYLTLADDAGLLTEKGAKALDSYRRLDTICMKNTYGDISEQGAYEHRELAKWMGDRWPRVFRTRDRRKVTVECSYIPRCVHSMENFVSSLSDKYPKLDFAVDTSRSIYCWLVNNEKLSKATRAAKVEVEQIWGRNFDWQPFLSSLFTDPQKAVELAGSEYLLCESLYTNASMVPGYAPDSGIDVISLFSDEEFAEICRCYNNKTWGGHCNSTTSGDWRIHRMDSLLVRYVEDADRAISGQSSGNGVAANLRFGHDTALMPLLSLMGVNHFDKQVSVAEADRYFDSSMDMTMASNLVMVFYRGRRGDDTLVKFVHNGRETTIPALEPVEGPYYSWPLVRQWFLSRAGRL